MASIKEMEDRVLDKILSKTDITTAEKEKVKGWGRKIESFIWTIAKFIFLTYLFNKLYTIIGFEKTIIIMMVTIILTLRSNLRNMARQAQKEEK